MTEQYDIPPANTLREQQVKITDSFISNAVDDIVKHILTNAKRYIINADKNAILERNVSEKIGAHLFSFPLDANYSKNFRCKCTEDNHCCFLLPASAKANQIYPMRYIITGDDPTFQHHFIPVMDKLKAELCKLGYHVGISTRKDKHLTGMTICTIFVEWDNPSYVPSKKK